MKVIHVIAALRRGGAEVGMIAVHHLGGALGISCVGLGNAKRWRRLNVGNHYPENPHTRIVTFTYFAT